MADKEYIQKNADRLIFALDTGTRSVVGALGLWEDDVFHIVDYEQCPHKTRAMKDGQIEDIGQAARAIQTVKDALEQRWEIQLTKVSIAAAGRALKTVSQEFGQEIPIDTPITAEQIRTIEYGAVSAALDTFGQEEESDGGSGHQAESETDGQPAVQDAAQPAVQDAVQSAVQNAVQPGDFSCVGYSVSGYWLDDYPISNLEGHRGKRMRASVIAAFLPQSVVRSLYAATSQCGLEVASLTLEPIAAIQAIVPGDLRLLNLAIADIGAGTSDIAVTRNGSVVAYDMVTLAGDEVTEALMRRCLTDFDTAEQIKLSLCRGTPGESIPFTDILGNDCSIDFETAMEVVEPAAEALCREITDCIIRINGASPAAVFLIGGGSQLSGLARRIADRLELPENRVALGGVRPYPHIQVCSQQLLSPEFVTPLGIGAISTLVRENDYLSVQINGQKIMIPGAGSLKIVDALLLAGIRSSSLMGRTPPSLIFYKNSQPQTFRSSPSTPGELYRNGVPATLNTQIRQGDEITLIPAKNGASPQIFLRDICEFGENVICTVNGQPGAPDYRICPQDDIRIFSPEPHSDESRRAETPSDGRPVEADLNENLSAETPSDGRSVEADLTENLWAETPSDGRPVEADLDENLWAETPSDGRLVEVDLDESSRYEAPSETEPQQGHVLPEALHSEASRPGTLAAGNEFSGELRIQLNGRWVAISRPAAGSLYFVDLLNYVNIDPKKPNGSPVLLLNGREAAYLDPVSDGDQVEIHWSKEKGFL